MKKSIPEIIATFFYLGYFPVAPGTLGSLIAICIYFFIHNSMLVYVFVTLAFIILGFVFCGRAEDIIRKKDSPNIIIDEIAGMLLALFAVPFKAREIFLTFLLFRIFDILKIPPADTLQKRRGSLGMMSDDIVAALYANLIIQLVLRVLM